MKKFFSLIALVGVFAACQPEDLTTSFNVEPAQLKIKASAYSDFPDFNQSDVSWTTDLADAVVAGNEITLTKQTIAAGSATVTGTYGKTPKSSKVDYLAVPAGWKAEVSTMVVFPFDYEGYEYNVVEKESETVATDLYYLKAIKHGHAYHAPQALANISTWYGENLVAELIPEGFEEIPMLENADDFILQDSYTYPTFDGEELAEDGELEILNNNFEAGIRAFFAAEGFADSKIVVEDSEPVNFNVSAWALYNALTVVCTTTTTYDIVATPKAGADTPALADEVVATFKMVSKTPLTGVVEMAHPDHGSHYQLGHGHGHGHGATNNAGGGLVEAE